MDRIWGAKGGSMWLSFAPSRFKTIVIKDQTKDQLVSKIRNDEIHVLFHDGPDLVVTLNAEKCGFWDSSK